MKATLTSTFGIFPALTATCLTLGLAGICLAQEPTKLDPPVKPTVEGKFIGNGKNSALKFVRVEESEPFSDKQAIQIIFTEKDSAPSKQPDFDASFGKLGNALVVRLHYDGAIFGCQVHHTAHEKQGFSSVGVIKIEDFKMVGGNVSGRLTTGKEQEFFGDTWDVDVKFAAPLPGKLRNAPAAPAKPTTKDASVPKEVLPKETKPADGPLIAASKLALPNGAADVEFKKIVNQIHFTSPKSVSEVTKEFAANLKKQGWKDSAGSVSGKSNAILKREQGAAKLTIMIQPATQGCSVKIFTDGLDWSEVEATPPSTIKQSADSIPSVDEIEAKAHKALDEALKHLRK